MAVSSALVALVLVILIGHYFGFRTLVRLISEEANTTRSSVHSEGALMRVPRWMPSFVSLLVVGRDAKGAPAICGTSALLTDDRQVTLELRAQVPLTDAYSVILCDESRVEVMGIFRGVDLVQAGVGSCPMGVIGTWHVGVLVRAVVSLRKAAS